MELPTPQDIRERRTELDLTQSELADQAGVSQPLIARIEGGDVDPRLSTLRRIVDALDQSEGDIVRAGDLMHEQVAHVAPDDSVSAAVAEMQDAGYSQLPVIENGVPVGSISFEDLMSVDEDARDRPVSEYMGESFPTKSPNATLDEISTDLGHNKAVIVTERGNTVGIITEADIAARLS
ncbi:CBS domain-containing protein [Halorussus amylolyticus]|uniref:CBS domain-containing protein n=1 Tax=Halorussus amylolyticus TaxID=1126242 RepID=UPI001044F3D0|nr:CBS domain-containing protein [Halorussus amylolyticus]